MKEAVRRQIGLVIGVERINEPRGHQVGELGESPRHRHDQREHEVGAAEHEQRATGSAVSTRLSRQIGSVAEPVIALSDPVDRVVGNVVEKVRSVGKSTQQVEAIVAFLRRQDGFDCHEIRSTVSLASRRLQGSFLLYSASACLNVSHFDSPKIFLPYSQARITPDCGAHIIPPPGAKRQ